MVSAGSVEGYIAAWLLKLRRLKAVITSSSVLWGIPSPGNSPGVGWNFFLSATCDVRPILVVPWVESAGG